MLKITKANFVISVANKENLLNSELPEFAFVGRSNAGKSSLLNSLVHQKKLAKTSSTPGHTRLINYFLVNDSLYFVDLPGYGYHKAGKANEQRWASLIEDYLKSSASIKRIFLLVDIRHEPSILDQQMMLFLSYNQIPFSIIATKSDKVPKSKKISQLSMIARSLKIGIGNIYPYSSETGYGQEKILDLLHQDLTNIEE